MLDARAAFLVRHRQLSRRMTASPKAFIRSFAKEIIVGLGEAKLRYTIPEPQDSRIVGMDAGDVAVPRPVLSTVNGGSA